MTELPLDTREPYFGSWGDWVWDRERQAAEDPDYWCDEELPDRVFTRLTGGWTPTTDRCPRCREFDQGCRHYVSKEDAVADFHAARAAAEAVPIQDEEFP